MYDGHGGSKAAEFVAENLHLRIFDMLEKNSENKEKEAACKKGYLKTDEDFLKQVNFLRSSKNSCFPSALLFVWSWKPVMSFLK